MPVDLTLVGIVGFLVRYLLIADFPAVHGGDAVVRLAHSDTLILAHQLPLPQLLVVVTRWLAPDPFWTRLVFAAIGALVPVALALAMAPAFGHLAARIAAVLASLHPLLLHYSTVPYQEGPMLLFLLLGGAFLARGRERWAAVFLGLACLCRYEAWIAAGLAILAQRRRPFRAALLFGGAPLLWIVLWRGLSPSGTYVLDLDSLAWHGSRVLYLFGKLREYSGDALFVLALLGGAFLARRRDQTIRWTAAFLAAFLVLVFTVGPEFPPHSGLISERLAHVPAVFLCALAGLGAARLIQGNEASDASGRANVRSRAARPLLEAAVSAAVAVVCLAGFWRAAGLAAESNADPSLRLAQDLARFCDAALPPGGRVAVWAPPIPTAALDDYVAKVGRVGGEPGRAAQWVRDLGIRSPDAERVAAHLPRSPRSVVPPGGPAELTAVFDGILGPPLAARGVLVARFLAGRRFVDVYRPPVAGEPAPPQ